MKTLIFALILTSLGVYFYFSRYTRKYVNDNHGRRSGIDRRKSFIAAKNRLRRSDKERRHFPDRRREPRFG